MKNGVVAVVFLCGLFFAQRADALVVWAVDTPLLVPVLGIFADHTYSCIGSPFTCYEIMTGAMISTTTNAGVVNQVSQISTALVQRARDHALCCAKSMRYGIDGVCHQHSNQVLQYGGAELTTSVKGYALTRWWYGPRGICNCPL